MFWFSSSRLTSPTFFITWCRCDDSHLVTFFNGLLWKVGGGGNTQMLHWADSSYEKWTSSTSVTSKNSSKYCIAFSMHYFLEGNVDLENLGLLLSLDINTRERLDPSYRIINCWANHNGTVTTLPSKSSNLKHVFSEISHVFSETDLTSSYIHFILYALSTTEFIIINVSNF